LARNRRDSAMAVRAKYAPLFSYLQPCLRLFTGARSPKVSTMEQFYGWFSRTIFPNQEFAADAVISKGDGMGKVEECVQSLLRS